MIRLASGAWRHFEPEIIVRGVRWYLRYALSDRDIEALMRERGLWIDHTTGFRRVPRYVPDLDKRCCFSSATAAPAALSILSYGHTLDELAIRLWHDARHVA